MDNLKNRHIIFLSFGSYATRKSLIYSQMIKFANELNNKNIFKSVSSIVIMPKLSTYRRYKTHNKNIEDLKSSVKIKLFFFYSWLLNGKMYSFLFKKFFYKFIVDKLYKSIKNLDGEIIFHCRSYYATDLALFFKEKYPDKNIKVVFDMRSLLPPEFPYTSKLFGKFLYVKGKEWERELIKSADLTLVVTKNAINLLKLEDSTYKNIKYIPIIGFSKADRNNQNHFEQRWQNKSFAYVGSIGLWHSLDAIKEVKELLEREFENKPSFVIASGNPNIDTDIKVVSIANDEMPSFYMNQLAIVIPGVLKDIDYFKSLKMTSNFFSTKAAEALSLGIPLIVNKQISELASLVEKYECGLVFEYDEKSQVCEFLNVESKELNNKDFWKKLSNNALKVGENFTKEYVESLYIKYWSEL